MEPFKISVYDTYVPKKVGGVMHPRHPRVFHGKDLQKIHGYGKEYLKLKGQDGQPLTAKECCFWVIRKRHGCSRGQHRGEGLLHHWKWRAATDYLTQKVRLLSF